MMVDFTERFASTPKSGALEPSHLDFAVVGIGASAGGLQAVKRFFENMPKDNGMAFVVIFHLSPDHQSSAGKLIEQATQMPVIQVTSAVPIQKNHVYVISPAQHLSMNDGHLRVLQQAPRRGGHVTIDLFFRDLAEVHKERAFCLVLSGTGSDGAVGLSRIKEQGGITLAQLPGDAEFDGMPQAAIETGMVDFVLPVVEMPQKILDLWRNSRDIELPMAAGSDLRTHLPSNERAAALAEQHLHDILLKLRTGTGHDFRHYKRATVLRRIERRMQVTARADLSAYYEYLCNTPQETKALLDDMLIGVTNFFRDRESFESLERDVIPQLFSHSANEASNSEVRVWSAGTSTGEEAYSLAMALNDYKAGTGADRKVQIFASDIDDRAITTGRAGLYPEAIITDVSPTRLRQYFVKEDNRYRVRKELRENVLFAKHSLLSDPPFSQMNLIVCRNLLIYLDREVQREILQMFHFALSPGGYLFLGNSESADMCHELFNPVDKKNRIFRARTGAIPSHRMPAMPRDGYARAASIPRPPLTPPARKPSTSEIHQRALERFSPPSIIVNSDAEILHISEGAGRYLHHMAGEVTRNLLSLITTDLRLELRTAMFQAQQTNLSVKARPVSLVRDEHYFQVAVTAHPFTDAQTETECLLIVFLEEEIDAENVSANATIQSENQMLSNLERELQRTKLQLQDTIEQSEISSEELKASNEEMQAINEELRSATEELETSKEELQSINEELLTVNHELKVKVEETDQINDYLSNLISSTDIATVFVDRNLRIKWFTPRATDIFSMLSVDTGRPLMDITHRLNYDQMVDDALRVFETLSVIEREIPSDNDHWYIARLLPYRSSSDQIDGIVLTFIDITKRRAAEEDLRLGEERMRLVAESTRDYAIVVTDNNGLITSWNQGAEIIFGYGKTEAEGRSIDFIFTEEDRAAGTPAQEMATVRAKGRCIDERWYLRRDGARFYCSGEVVALQGEGVQGFVKIARDLTEHVKLNEQQLNSLKESQTSSHLKDEFFAVMSHELKHPLNLIQLNAQVLRRLPAVKNTPAAVKAVSVINDAVTSQARIIDDLMDVARVNTGKLQLERKVVDFAALLREIEHVADNSEHSCEIIFDIPSRNDGGLFLHADQTRIEQIVWNLINNAIKFTPAGGQIRVTASRLDGRVRLEVQDTGPGIAQDQLEHIFEMFGQANHRPVVRNNGGLGIGLSLVKQLVESHEGFISAYSDGPGKGATFVVELPVCGVPAPLAAVAEHEEDGKLRGLSILLVDDSVDVLETMAMLLEMESAQVAAFSSPAEALVRAPLESFDVVISDLNMPSMDGYQFVDQLRRIPGYRSTPCIALTGYGASLAGTDGKGFDEHVGKPVAYDAFVALVARLGQTALAK